MQLIEVQKGRTVRMKNYRGGLGVGFKLRQLGLSPGKEIKILRYAPLEGPIMIEVGGRSVALGRGIAARVQVEDV